ncbi:MAG: 23S rRNA (pseudouridine(1915)-N(3))-methyltransferase RlmH [Terracidiphilus sp.]
MDANLIEAVKILLMFETKGIRRQIIPVHDSSKYEITDNSAPAFQKRGPPLLFGDLLPLRYPPLMLLTLAHVGPRPAAKDGFDALARVYLERCSAFARCQTEAFRSEEAWLEWLAKQQGRTPAIAVLLDSRGRQMTSEAFASWLGTRRDEGAQHIVFAIGPADGWSDAARGRSHLLLSLGPMTLAHALARLVMAEQLYRAFTILSGHPYHAGH